MFANVLDESLWESQMRENLSSGSTRGRIGRIAGHMSIKTHKGKSGNRIMMESKQLIPILSTLLVQFFFLCSPILINISLRCISE